METRLQAYLFTDLVDSTRLKSDLGDVEGARLIAAHDALFRECLRRFDGVERSNPGDGFFATFDLPSRAVSCAIAFQGGLRKLNGTRIRTRVGVHMGEAVQLPPEGELDGKFLGLAVDMAGRVMSLAESGQTLVTRHAFDSVRQQLVGGPDGEELEWRAHGRYLFKGGEEPIEIFEVGVAGDAPLHPPKGSKKARRLVEEGDEETLGWRPALKQFVPGRANWELVEKLGAGGFGEVWRARNTATKDDRCFKFCFDAKRLRSLKREMTLFRWLKGGLGERADIARLYDVQLEDPPFFLELDYSDGGSLPVWANAQGGLAEVPESVRIKMIAQVADALHAAHSVGVLHKDIKPSNVLVAKRPHADAPQCRLTDFGIGELTELAQFNGAEITETGFDDATLTELGIDTGTRMFMAPELLAGTPASTASDVYSLGVLAYQMAVGDFERPLGQGWERDIQDPVLRQDIAACVAGNPAERLASARELSARLRSLQHRRRRRRAKLFAGATAVTITAVLVVFGIMDMIETSRAREQREKDLALARRARLDAERIGREHLTREQARDALRARLSNEHVLTLQEYAPRTKRLERVRLEDQEDRIREQMRRLAGKRRSQLDLARQLETRHLGQMSPATRSAFVAYYRQLREAARRDGNETLVKAFDDEVRRLGTIDSGDTVLTVHLPRASATAHLFRYVNAQDVHADDVLPRLVPAPTNGLRLCRKGEWVPGWHPGDTCLVVTDCPEGCAGWKLGLRRHDLILEIHGAPAGARLLVAAAPEGLGIQGRSVVENFNGYEFPGRTEVRLAKKDANEIRAGGRIVTIGDLGPSGLRLLSPKEMLLGEEGNFSLKYLQRGEPKAAFVNPGMKLGIEVERTAYPLILHEDNRVEPGAEIAIAPGSYLLFVSEKGVVPQRVPLLVRWRTPFVLRVDAVEHAPPPGYVVVPGGPFLVGGDPDALNAARARIEHVDTFFIARTEVTVREWYEFVNSLPPTEQEQHLTRNQKRTFGARNSDGSWRSRVASNDSPAYSVSAKSIDAFLRWKNSTSSTWEYELPTDLEWEKAARGVDGRAYVWGDRFDPSLCVTHAHSPAFQVHASYPAGSLVFDESVYGARDMAGFAKEYTAAWTNGDGKQMHSLRGGPFGDADPDFYRCARRFFVDPESSASGRGFRLVARRLE